MTELKDTVDLMNSQDYKERFIAEYYQLKIRCDKLLEMIIKWDNGTLEFTPTCSREIYSQQIKYMKGYLKVLEVRAGIENINLSKY